MLAISQSTPYTSLTISFVMTSEGVPEAYIVPPDITTTVSAYFAAMFRSWLIIITSLSVSLAIPLSISVM